MNSVGARVFSCRYMTYKNFYLLPNLKKKVISGLIFVAIIVGFGLFLYYNGGGSDQVLALVAERTFDQVCYLMCRCFANNRKFLGQSYGMLLLFVFLLSWDSMELMFGILFIPWKNLPLRRSQDEPKQPVHRTYISCLHFSESISKRATHLLKQVPLWAARSAACLPSNLCLAMSKR